MSLLWRVIPSRDLLRLPIVRWLVIARFFENLFFYSTTLVLFQQQRGLNFTEMFLMESILSWTIWLADIPTSLWAERIGYARVMLIGRGAGLLGMLVFAFAHGFWFFALAEVLGGFAVASTSGCESALVYDSLPAHQRDERGGEAFTLLSSASSAGFFLGLSTGSFLGAYSPELAVWVSLIPSLLVCLATFRLNRYMPTTPLQAKKEHIYVRKILLQAGASIRSQPIIIFLSLFRSLAFALTNAIFWYNQPFFQHVGIPVVWFGPFTAIAMGVQLLLLLRLPAFQRAPGPRFVLLFSCLIPGLCYLFLAWTPWPAVTVLLVMGIISCSAWCEPIVEQELNKRITDLSRATTLSVLALIGALAKGILDPFIGHAGDLGLNMVSLALGLSLIGLSLCAPFLLIARPRPAEIQ